MKLPQSQNGASKCEAVKPYENPTFQQMNCLLTNAAIDADIPPEVVKAVATQETAIGNNLMKMVSQSSLQMAASGHANYE